MARSVSSADLQQRRRDQIPPRFSAQTSSSGEHRQNTAVSTVDGAQRGRVRRQGRGRLSNTSNRLVPTFMCIPAGYPNLPRPQFTRFLMDDVVDRADRTHSLGIKHTESINRAASSTRFGGCQVFPASITTLTNYPDPSSRCGAAGRAIFLLSPCPL